MLLIKYSLLPVMLALMSCGSPDGSTWLIRTSTNDISVQDAGKIWNDLNENERTLFLQENNPVACFVSELGWETMILQEINNIRYLHSPLIRNIRKSWITTASTRAYNDSLSISIRDEITTTDLFNYDELLGVIVWYSTSTEELAGPVRLPDLQWPLAFAFDTMAVGSSVEIDGIAYTLDSCITSTQPPGNEPQQVIHQTNSFALTRLTRSRVDRNLRCLTAEMLGAFSVDSASILMYCTNRDSLSNTVQLALWGTGNITAEGLDGLLAFNRLGQALETISPQLIYHILKDQARLKYIEEAFSELCPADYAGIIEKADDFASNQARELLFRENVTNSIVITDSMVFEAYSRMDSIPMIPETRTFTSIQAPLRICEEILVELSREDTLPLLNYSGYSEFLLPGSELISRPVTISELPVEIGRVLFHPADIHTGWYGPSSVGEDLFIIYRLDHIVLTHPVPFENLQESIEHRLLIHSEEQRTMEWMCELEASHDFHINHNILGDLPADPADWSEL